MSYQSETGDLADPTFPNQVAQAFDEVYYLEGSTASIAGSSNSIQTAVGPATFRFGNEFVRVEQQQTIMHPDGDADYWRVDAITVDGNGSAGRTTGTPAPRDPPEKLPPRTRTPIAPDLAGADVVCIAWLLVPPGVTSSEELFEDYIVPRAISGTALNNLDLIPGRDLQYVINNAREGETLRADASTTITLPQPLTVGTKGVDIEGLDVRYAGGAATSDTDDTITIAADGVTLRDVTIDGNKANQTAEPDGVTVTASDAKLENVTGRNIAGHLANLNGATNTVRGTSIEGLYAFDCRKDALVIQGGNVTGTRGETIESERSANRGAVTIRNGPADTALSEIRATDQSDGLVIEDFGPDNSASAPVNNTTIDGLNATRCDRAVDAAHSDGVPGEFLTLCSIRVANMNTAASVPSTPNNLINVDNIATVDITDCRLRDSGYTDGYQLAVANSFRTTIDNCKLSNAASDFGLLRLYNANAAKALANDLYGSPGDAIFATAGGEGVARVRIGDNDIGSMAGADMRFTEQSGGTFDRVSVTDNTTEDGGITGTITGENNISGNL